MSYKKGYFYLEERSQIWIYFRDMVLVCCAVCSINNIVLLKPRVKYCSLYRLIKHFNFLNASYHKMVLQLAERLAVQWYVLNLLCFPCPSSLLCMMFCRWNSQLEDGNSVLQQLPGFHNWLVVQSSVTRVSGGDVIWTTLYRSGNWVFLDEEKVSAAGFWKTFSCFSWVKTGKILIRVFSDAKQGTEFFPHHPLAMAQMGIHFIGPSNYFGLLLNILTIFYIKNM